MPVPRHEGVLPDAGADAVTFAKTKSEKIRLTRRVRECMSQYQRMQREDMREIFPDWFAMEGESLSSAKVTLDLLIREHNREVDRRERQAAAKRATEGGL